MGGARPEGAHPWCCLAWQKPGHQLPQPCKEGTASNSLLAYLTCLSPSCSLFMNSRLENFRLCAAVSVFHGTTSSTGCHTLGAGNAPAMSCEISWIFTTDFFCVPDDCRDWASKVCSTWRCNVALPQGRQGRAQGRRKCLPVHLAIAPWTFQSCHDFPCRHRGAQKTTQSWPASVLCTAVWHSWNHSIKCDYTSCASEACLLGSAGTCLLRAALG